MEKEKQSISLGNPKEIQGIICVCTPTFKRKGLLGYGSYPVLARVTYSKMHKTLHRFSQVRKWKSQLVWVFFSCSESEVLIKDVQVP